MTPRPDIESSRRPDAVRPTFGERVEIVNRLLGGQISRAEVCRRVPVSAEQLEQWIHTHARDRPLSLDEFRFAPTLAPAMRQLVSRLVQLQSLLSARQRELHLLKQIARDRGLI